MRIRLEVGTDSVGASRAAADDAARIIAGAIAARGRARVIFASAPSQESMLAALVTHAEVDFSRLRAFHMDEYLGLAEDDPRSFGRWLTDRIGGVAPHALERLTPANGTAAECRRYAALLTAAPIDLVCMGIGVNGHIAFNEPGQARFDDPEPIREVRLTEASRRQQVDEGLFPTLAGVPTAALTLTVPTLLSAAQIVVTALGTRKATAVAAAIDGPVESNCPASALQTHPAVVVHLDEPAAAGLAGRPGLGL